MVKNVFKKLGKKQKNNKGFSLVELIVVIAIMAVLVGVLAPQLIKYVEKSREATDIQNCDSIATSIKAYFADKEGYTGKVTVTVPKTKPATGKAVTAVATVTTSDADTKVIAALNDAGLDDTVLKGSKWTSGIEIQYDLETGKITYGASSTYYEATVGTDERIKGK